MAKKDKNRIGYDERELVALLSGGKDLIQSNIEVLERRLGEQRFVHKHPHYERKLEQLQELLTANLSEDDVEIVRGLATAREPLSANAFQSALKRFKLHLPLTEQEMRNG